MVKCHLICLFVGLLVGTSESSREETLSSVLFTSIGQATLQIAYGQLLVPLNIPSLKKGLHYADLQSSINKLVASNMDFYNHLQSELATCEEQVGYYPSLGPK